MGGNSKNWQKSITVPKLIDRCTNLAQVQANRVYGKAFDECAKKTGKKVKYARVAFGTTCSYCLMLASRDHDYNSAESAMRCSHAHCDCMVKPEDVKVPEYDPEKLFAQWQEKETKRITDKGLHGSSAEELEKIRKEYPKAYNEWMKWTNTPNIKIRKQKQLEHVLNTPSYINRCKQDDEEQPSYFVLKKGDIYNLVSQSIGKGYPKYDENGNWSRFYVCICDKVIGYDALSKTSTRAFKVNCISKEGIHAYPIFDEGLIPDEL